MRDIVSVPKFLELALTGMCNHCVFWVRLRHLNMERSLFDGHNRFDEQLLLLDVLVEPLMEGMVKGKAVICPSI